MELDLSDSETGSLPEAQDAPQLQPANPLPFNQAFPVSHALSHWRFADGKKRSLLSSGAGYGLPVHEVPAASPRETAPVVAEYMPAKP